jgi:hypothetical protein
MKNVLICSIVRDQHRFLGLWWLLLRRLYREIQNEYNVSLSIYENDSIDDSKNIIYRLIEGKFTETVFKTENLGTKKYGSVWDIDRIKNLSNARNQCLNNLDLDKFDKIVYIEPDITYSSAWCSELILARHPEQAGITPDIYSAWSLRPESHPKESMYLYDTCATRQYKNDVYWNLDKEKEWINNSLIQTNLGGIDGNCLHKVYSTFNCFCVYNAEPFKQGLRWGYINDRLNASNIKAENGWLDADTSVICESFRRIGYENILLNRNCIVRHV